MTLLSTIQTVAKELSLAVPTSVIGTTDATVKQLLAFAERAGKEARNKFRWPELNREFTFTLATSTANYALNDDFDYQIHDTHYDRSNSWPLLGPVTPQEWQLLKSGITTAGQRKRFRVKGIASNQLYIDPTPTSSDNGNTLVLEYQSKNWIRPKTWAASTAFAAGAYCFYNGNWYYTSSAGTTGSTAPTHTTGSTSDGGITWAYYSSPYDTFTADTDVSLLDEDILAMDIQWRFRRDAGLEFEDFRRETNEAWARASTSKSGMRTLPITPSGAGFLLGEQNIPEDGYGQ